MPDAINFLSILRLSAAFIKKILSLAAERMVLRIGTVLIPLCPHVAECTCVMRNIALFAIHIGCSSGDVVLSQPVSESQNGFPSFLNHTLGFAVFSSTNYESFLEVYLKLFYRLFA